MYDNPWNDKLLEQAFSLFLVHFSEVVCTIGPDAHCVIVLTPNGCTGNLTQQIFQSAAWHTVLVPDLL